MLERARLAVCGGCFWAAALSLGLSVGEDGLCGAPVREPIGPASSIRTVSGQKEGEKGFPLGRTVAFPLGLRV